MKKFPSLALCLVLFFLSGTSRAGDENSFWAQVTFTKGEVSVTRNGEEKAVPLERGQVVHQGDQIHTGKGSRASLLRHDGSIKVVAANRTHEVGSTDRQGDGEGLKTVAGNLSKTLMSRGGDNPMLKHLGGLRGDERNLALSPSRTKVIAGDTELIWLPKYGTKKFQVTLMGPGDSLFEKMVEGTTLVVPAEEFKAGETYWWEVRDPRSRNAISSLGHGSFATLAEDEEKAVRAMLAEVDLAFGEDADDSSGDFLRYQIYLEYGLHLDALRTLQGILGADGEDAGLLRRRKDLCDEMQIDEKDLQLISTS